MTDTEVTVHVEARPGAANFGDTNIVVKEQDPDRSEFLTHCDQFFRSRGRTETADKFYSAEKQTASD